MAEELHLMDPMRELGKVLLVLGVVLVAAGALLVFGVRLPSRLGRLPGDIAYQGRNGSFYFPIVTCILLSLALTLLMWIVNFFRR
jgi:hypothetical protein